MIRRTSRRIFATATLVLHADAMVVEAARVRPWARRAMTMRDHACQGTRKWPVGWGGTEAYGGGGVDERQRQG